MARIVSNSRVCSKYLTTKISLFIVNYRKELRIRANIRKKRKSKICKKNKEKRQDNIKYKRFSI